MKKIIFLLFLGLFLNSSNNVFAQGFQLPENNKVHYEIKNLSSYSNPSFVEQAAYEFSKFDNIRYINKRRQVKLQGTDVIIELYSGEELKQIYQKEICVLNIDDSKPHPQVELYFVESKHPIFEIREIK